MFSVFGILVPLAPKSFPIPLLITSSFLLQFGSVAYNVTQVSLRQAITPERLQGRMNAAMRWIVWGTIPLGTLAGGALASEFGLRAALWIGSIGAIPTFLFVAFSPVRAVREMPEPVVEPTPGQAEMAGGIVEPAPMVVEPGPAASD
jgi:MFS family permease